MYDYALLALISSALFLSCFNLCMVHESQKWGGGGLPYYFIFFFLIICIIVPFKKKMFCEGHIILVYIYISADLKLKSFFQYDCLLISIAFSSKYEVFLYFFYLYSLFILYFCIFFLGFINSFNKMCEIKFAIHFFSLKFILSS